MRIRYAVSTMLFWYREHNLSFEQECNFLRSLGFGVELRPTIRGQNECRYERSNWTRLREATKDMLVSMRSRNDGPTLAQWNEQIECAKLLAANIVADLPSLCISDQLESVDWSFASKVVRLAELNKVKLCVETGRLNTLLQAGEKFDSLWYCLDTGILNLDPEFTFKRYVDELAPRVTHLHLTDNYGRADDHQPPGLRGGIDTADWDYLLNALSKYDNDVIGSFEMAPGMPWVMIRQGTEFLFDVIKWPNRPKRAASYIVYNPI